MKTRIVFIALAMCVNVLSANGQTLLQWNLSPGIAYDVERTATQKQTVEIQGKATTEERKSVWRVRLQSLEQRGDDFLVKATLSDVRHHITGVDKAELLDTKLDEKMKDAVFILRITPSGRILEIAGYEDLLKRLAGEKKASVNSLRAAFPAAMLHDIFVDMFGVLPNRAVNTGDFWAREIVEPIPHFGNLIRNANYTYEGGDENVARITAKITTTFELPKNESGVVFRVVEGTIASEKSSGRLVFDRKARHVSRHVRTTALTGKLVIEAANQRQTIEFSSFNESIITVAGAKK